MKYKPLDKVRIKSLDWYNENKDEYGYINCGSRAFFSKMKNLCGKIATIKEICKTNYYHLKEYNFDWTDEMIEGLVEEETLIEKVDDTGLPFNEWLYHKGAFYIPEDYVLKDENGNVINATKIVLEKKKKEYPKTYEECAKVLLDRASVRNDFGYKGELLVALQKLLVCRDAYWKIAGEEMGLGKPWEPDWTNQESPKYCIAYVENQIKTTERYIINTILSFPTEEMRDAFYENFKELINECKELL